jgi:hypothetical protein
MITLNLIISWLSRMEIFKSFAKIRNFYIHLGLK